MTKPEIEKPVDTMNAEQLSVAVAERVFGFTKEPDEFWWSRLVDPNIGREFIYAGNFEDGKNWSTTSTDGFHRLMKWCDDRYCVRIESRFGQCVAFLAKSAIDMSGGNVVSEGVDYQGNYHLALARAVLKAVKQ